MRASYFGFVEELSETASGILLRVQRHLQDELHDYSLVSHLLHQGFFLQDPLHNVMRILHLVFKLFFPTFFFFIIVENELLIIMRRQIALSITPSCCSLMHHRIK